MVGADRSGPGFSIWGLCSLMGTELENKRHEAQCVQALIQRAQPKASSLPGLKTQELECCAAPLRLPVFPAAPRWLQQQQPPGDWLKASSTGTQKSIRKMLPVLMNRENLHRDDVRRGEEGGWRQNMTLLVEATAAHCFLFHPLEMVALMLRGAAGVGGWNRVLGAVVGGRGLGTGIGCWGWDWELGLGAGSVSCILVPGALPISGGSGAALVHHTAVAPPSHFGDPLSEPQCLHAKRAEHPGVPCAKHCRAPICASPVLLWCFDCGHGALQGTDLVDITFVTLLLNCPFPGNEKRKQKIKPPGRIGGAGV